MKIIKKVGAFFAALMLCVSGISVVAYAADGSISFTDPETAVGEMVDIKCVIRSGGGNLGDIEISLSYDSASLRFESGEGVTSNGSGSLTYAGTGGSGEVSFTMQFQALAEGSAKVSIADASVTSDYGGSLSMEEGDSTVSIGPGDPSKIQPETPPAASGGDMQVEIDGVSYTLTDNFADADIPSGYSRTSVTLEGKEHQMAVNEEGTVYLGYLLDAQGLGEFYVYNTEDATFSPYEEIAISDTTSIIVLSDTSKVKLPDSYQRAKLTLNDKVFPVWQDNEHDGYYIMYAINNNGETGYYQYDSGEGTFQRVEIAEEEKKEADDGSLTGKIRNILDNHLQMLVIILGIGGLFVLILILVLAIKLRNRNLELDDLYDEYGIDLDEEPEEPAPKNKKSGKSASSKGGSRHKYADAFLEDEDDFEEDFEEDDFEEEDFEEDDFERGDFEEEDFEEADFEEDDIFSDKKLAKYDTKTVHQGVQVSGLEEEDEDGLGELMEDLSMGSRGHQEEDDAFKVDIVDLD